MQKGEPPNPHWRCIKAEIVALAQVDQMKRKWVPMTQLLLCSYQVAEIPEDELKDMLAQGTLHVVFALLPVHIMSSLSFAVTEPNYSEVQFKGLAPKVLQKVNHDSHDC